MSQRHTDVPSQVEPAGGDDRVDSSVDQACSVLEVLNRISGKWAIGILLLTTQRPMRFTELEREVTGISRRMLTLTLRNLERDGLLIRTVYPTVPPRTEYEATPMARELYRTLLALTGWADRHRHEIASARKTFDEQ
ncbi:helix-turn-helix transcriptional regulator [Nocardia sp. NBC_00565]|uniref:winged helix-turn-helix transcriptional regulator n=1 Tax=Nocardia sp. NBC_00565 TaxID=2975993 RepID=UPI002E8185A1|nr:helix-turn-helix domain-containing protein [Nocardia sp. NBC_00565]WUC06173.1 helix-turn-helix transcriptional regulator [Nocardia sp. NBC_00565]